MFCEHCGEPIALGQEHLHPAIGEILLGAPILNCPGCGQDASNICVQGVSHWLYSCPIGHRWSNIPNQ